MRSPGIRLHKLALFGWAVVVTAVLLLLSLPVLAGKLLKLSTGSKKFLFKLFENMPNNTLETSNDNQKSNKHKKPNKNKWAVIVLFTVVVVISLAYYGEKYNISYMLPLTDNNIFSYVGAGLPLDIVPSMPWGALALAIPLFVLIYTRKDIDMLIIIKLSVGYGILILSSILLGNISQIIIAFRELMFFFVNLCNFMFLCSWFGLLVFFVCGFLLYALYKYYKSD
jgi:hypothetical protein